MVSMRYKMLQNFKIKKRSELVKFLFLCSLTILFLPQTLYATTITSNYTGGTITGGMLIDPSSNAITISGNTTISGASQVGGSGDSYSFRVAGGNLVTIASGATVGNALSNEIAFLYGSQTKIAGTVNFTTGQRVRFGVGGTGTGTMEVTGSLNVKTSGAFYFSNGGSGSTPVVGSDAAFTYTLNVNGGTVNLEGSGEFGIGCRNNVNLNVTNGGTLTLKSTTTTAGVCLCGVYGEWGGQENKTFNVNVENGTMTLDTAKDVTIGAAYASYNNNFTRKASFTVGSAGTLELNRTMSNANTGKTTISFAVNGGTLYAKTNDISLTSANSFSITGDAKIKVDKQLTLGAVGGAGSLHKQGAGTLKLTARETYTGTTYVEEGRLILAAEHSGSLKSKTMNVSAGAVLELASKNATDYGINSPDMVLGAKTDSKPGAELNLSMTANAWTSVCKLTMNDGSRITIADNLPKLPILYICKETTVPANSTARIDALVGMRTSGENGNLVNAGNFNIGEGGTLTLTNGLYAWGYNSKTNTLIKQGAGEMIVQGKTYASEGYELRVQVEAGKLVLENVDTVSTKSTFKSVLVKNGAELLLGGTIPSTTAITVEGRREIRRDWNSHDGPRL